MGYVGSVRLPWPGKPLKNRTVRAVISATTLRQTYQCVAHGDERLNSLIQIAQVTFRELLHLRTGALPVIPERQKLANLLQGEPEITGTADELQRVQIPLLILPVARFGPGAVANQADLLVVADHLGRDTAGLGNCSDVHVAFLLSNLTGRQRQRRSSKAFDTTLTLENAMAAPAMTGFRSPAAARGMPTTL